LVILLNLPYKERKRKELHWDKYFVLVLLNLPYLMLKLKTIYNFRFFSEYLNFEMLTKNEMLKFYQRIKTGMEGR
jgi:hypothetical protein